MTISSQIIEVLNDLCMKFGMAIDWSQENVMPYLQELASKYISWEVATSWAWIIFCAILILIGIVICVIEYKTDFSCGIMYVISVITIVVVIGCLMSEIFDIMACKYFPEKAIFEYVKQLMDTAR